ncbi:hypothetical protein [Dactylosporangium sp. NPDC050588]|uniref:hypothetical protein n=1 Tax=Dactylosporangium sp. NPDC050588 TaxID=3157211 RepID=UPI0033D68F41
MPLPNTGNGITVNADRTIIGGDDTGSANVIGTNGANGIELDAATDETVIRGNAIGTDPTGAITLFFAAAACGVGGTSPAETFLGAVTVVTNANGNVVAATVPPVGTPAGTVVMATATEMPAAATYASRRRSAPASSSCNP